MGRQYEKNPKYFCTECHRSFKKQRALDAHNDALHAPEPVPEEHRLVAGRNHSDAGGGSDPVRTDSPPDLIIVDESTPFDPKWFDKL